MDKYAILESAKREPFEKIKLNIDNFIECCVFKDRRKRWHQISDSPEKLRIKFNSFLKSVDTDIAHLNFNLESLAQYDEYFYYFDMDNFCYLIKPQNAPVVCIGIDGFLFGSKKDVTVLFTHEDVQYLFINKTIK